ncbi:MAG: hypothetical protein RSG58_08130, partial [Eubacterium sp.]
MKKRASLLISGITTAALVVTAIGSFAAWDTLKGDTGTGLSVDVSNPIELKVDNVKSTADAEKKALVPTGADWIVDGTKEATEVTVGTFNAKLDGTTATKAVKDVTFTAQALNEGTVDNNYEVVLYKDETPVSGNSLTLTDLTKGQVYAVKVKIAESV